MPARPRYFLVRPGVTKQTNSGVIIEPGPMVPLIAVDQLPEWLEIEGLPRELKVEQTVGMSNLGPVARGQGTYEVNILHTDHGQHGRPHMAQTPGAAVATTGGYGIADAGTEHPDVGGRANSTANLGRDGVDKGVTNPVPPLHPADIMMAHVSPPSPATSSYITGRTAAAISASRGPSRGPSPSPSPLLTLPPPPPYNTLKPSKQPTAPAPIPAPVPMPSALGRSPFCRHWCHHGTCKWGLQCRYRHAMPTTVEGLAKVGLRDFPAWWTAAMGLTLSGLGGGGGGSGADPYDVRLAATRMDMFSSGKNGREFREMMKMGYGHGYRYGQRKEREPRGPNWASASLDKGRVKTKDARLVPGASSKDKEMIFSGGADGGNPGTHVVPSAGEKGQDETTRQTQTAVQQPEKLVDV